MVHIMFRTTSKNRKFFLSLLLVTYIVSAFQQPLQEVLHYLSHITDVAESNYVKHNHKYFHEHDVDHDHSILSLIDNQENDSQDPFTSIKNVKKKVEITWTTPLSLNLIRYSFNDFRNLLPCNQFFKEYTSPPPKSV